MPKMMLKRTIKSKLKLRQWTKLKPEKITPLQRTAREPLKMIEL
jgi:hypothetical protein